ncbi:MAG: patatin-like phospholipase family protein [Pseudomonadota bacterium]|nr:patatin-like phospholipase family protein [Pseudomonadota bacterium]
MPTEAYGIFQGGGAKGYAHVGALKAAEERGIEFVRIAGTSAGAIVASLATAGYTADELLDPTRMQGERGVLDIDPAEILEPSEFKKFERLASRYQGWIGEPSPRRGVIGAWHNFKRRNTFLLAARAFRALYAERSPVEDLTKGFGLIGTDPLIAWLDQLLSTKLGKSGQVTFGDLGMRLRMVAADLSTGLIHKFGFAGDEELAVAPAAVASACFPFFFRPVRQEDRMFVDGGLVSNLPVWLFDDERDDEMSHLPTFGFRLVNDTLIAKQAGAPTRFLPFVGRVVQTLSSGSRNLEERRVDYYHGIDLKARIGTLSFAEVRAAAPELVNEGRRCVIEYFEREVGPQDPERMRRVLSLAVDELDYHFDWRAGSTRAHILIPDADGRHAKTVYSLNMDGDADDRLRVRTDVNGVGAVFRLRQPIYLNPLPRSSSGFSALKYEVAMRPSRVAGMYAVPIFDDVEEWSKDDPASRSPPFAALVIDRDEDFGDAVIDESEQDTLANIAAIIGEEMRDRHIERATGNISPHAEATGWDQAESTKTMKLAARKIRNVQDGELGRRLSQALLRMNTASTPAAY